MHFVSLGTYCIGFVYEFVCVCVTVCAFVMHWSRIYQLSNNHLHHAYLVIGDAASFKLGEAIKYMYTISVMNWWLMPSQLGDYNWLYSTYWLACTSAKDSKDFIYTYMVYKKHKYGNTVQNNDNLSNMSVSNYMLHIKL